MRPGPGAAGTRRRLRSVTMTDGSEEISTAPDSGAELVDLASRRTMVVDEIPLSIPRGGQVLVFGGLRLIPGGTDITREISRTIAHAIESCHGPAVIVFAGDTFDMLREGRPDPDAAIAAHPRLASALGRVPRRAGAADRSAARHPRQRTRLRHPHDRDRPGQRLDGCARVRARDRHRLRRAGRARRARPPARPRGRVRRPA